MCVAQMFPGGLLKPAMHKPPSLLIRARSACSPADGAMCTAKYFTSSPPARACFAVKALPMNARVEIEAVAIRSKL